MNTFYIPESNVSRLEKKLESIKRKCNKNQLSFTCECVGEEFRECETSEGEKVKAKFFIYEVEGKIHHEGWRFVATLDHHQEGNIIRAINSDLVIPERFRTCGPTCEHCNKIRSRKDTYLIYNEELQEFKQVGKNCMQEYTNGLDAETVAYFVQFYEECESGFGGVGSNFTVYRDVENSVRYAFECYRHFGFESKHPVDEFGYEFEPKHTTAQRVRDYMAADSVISPRWLTPKERELIRQEMDEVGFNAESDYAIENTAKALEWIADVDTTDNSYLHNLQIVCQDEATEARNFGILVSLTAAYMRAVNKAKRDEEYNKRKEAEHSAELASEFQGSIKDRLTVNCTSFACITTKYSEWGPSYLYKFTDDKGNIYIWWGSRGIDEPEKVKTVIGTVKDHQEYNGVKQTVMTRCKVA